MLQHIVPNIVHLDTMEEEHAIQSDLFVYTRFHSKNIYSNDNQGACLQTYKDVFNLEVKMVEILTDLNLK